MIEEEFKLKINTLTLTIEVLVVSQLSTSSILRMDAIKLPDLVFSVQDILCNNLEERQPIPNTFPVEAIKSLTTL